MKILVTGGAGFIGSHVVDAYIKKGHEVVIFDDLSSGKKEYLNPKAIFVEGDLTHQLVIDTLFTDYGPFDVINHLAAQKSVSDSVRDPVNDATINILGSIRLFEAARKKNVKKIIFSSTGGALYGGETGLPFTEEAPILPQSPYAITKYSVENYLRFYQDFGLTTQILRYANVYGPRQDPHGEAGVVAIFSLKIIQGQPLVIYGDGSQTRDFTYVDDVVSANLVAIDNPTSLVCNIGTGQETSVTSLAEMLNEVAQEMGLSMQTIVNKAPRPGEVKKSALAITRAKKELNWQPRVNLRAGLTQTLRSFI